MAKRLYPENAVASYTPPTFQGAWSAANTYTGELGVKGGAAATVTNTHDSSAVAKDITWGKITTEPLRAGVLTGTVEWLLGARTSSTVGATFVFKVHIYVTVGATDVVRGTALTDFVGTTQFTTTSTGKGDGQVALTPVTVVAGDRICVEIGERCSACASQTVDVITGGTGAVDLTSGSTSTTTQPGWVEFSGADNLFNPILPPFNRVPLRRTSLW